MLGYGWPTEGNPIYLFIALVPLLYIENNLKGFLFFKFLFSFISFLVWNIIATFWLHYAKKVNGSCSLEAYLIPVFFNSLLMSTIFSFSSWIKERVESRKIGYIFLICFWILFEKIHLEWELSWPWLNLGNGFSNSVEWIQWYEYTGTFGGTLWIWIVNILFAESIISYQENGILLELYKKIFVNKMIVFSLIFISNMIYIKYENKEYKKYVDTLVLQPNIDPYYKKYNTSIETLIPSIKRMIDKKISKTSMLIIAPETVITGYKVPVKDINQNKVISIFEKYLKKKSPNSVFLTGIELFALYSDKNRSETSSPVIFSSNNKNEKWFDVFNSVIQIGVNSNENAVYFHHKSKLVPAVETFPYKKFLFPILGDVLLDFGGNVIELGKQKHISVFKHPYLKIKIAPIICYESVFGEYVSKFFKKNAELMVIITNDGWWENSQGHKQHCYYARLRAIENRKYVARSANTGISCFINERGDILSYIPYGKKDVLRRKVFINNKITFYSKNGDYISKISLMIVIIILSYIITYYIFREKIFQIF
ncbi:apolipoprotein N-acyltransferase [Blattabacterium cuenoti]|uniref:apolipoprotein N-acyltransferase n=1 Tax=Blattabacterium cuenoti TaxID=1653831 RepID=UPI001EECADB9|nr:apolipoprotein N-acyltransferase [Blattabacterium cuenoti]